MNLWLFSKGPYSEPANSGRFELVKIQAVQICMIFVIKYVTKQLKQVMLEFYYNFVVRTNIYSYD